MTAPASSRGFTLLELTLAVAISVAFLTAFLAASQALMQGLFMAGDRLGDQVETASAIDQMVYDIEQASSYTWRLPYYLDFQTASGDRIQYRMYATDGASGDVILERSVNGASESIGPKFAIANLNPYNADLRIVNNTPTASINLFSYNQPNTQTAPQVDIMIATQPSRESAVSYMRSKAVCQLLLSW